MTTPTRLRIVEIARSYIGEQDPDRFWQVVQPALVGHPHSISWCGGFALAVLHEAGVCDWPWLIWKGPGTNSGFLYRLPITNEPELGDIAYFDKRQHHAIVANVHASGAVDTIDGNTMPFPLEGVTVRSYRPGPGMHFYSIAPMLRELDTDPIASPKPSIAPPLPIIRRGSLAKSYRESVRLMQERLVHHGHATLVDGLWDLTTDAALYEFQMMNRLATDKVCGPRTWEKLLAD